MKKQNILSTILYLAIAFAFSSCQNLASENTQAILSTTPTISPTVDVSPTPTPNSNSPIRKIDFSNFVYPETKDYSKFKLENGEKLFNLEKKMKFL